MGFDLLTPTHILFLAVLGLLLFGPKRLPEMGRSLGIGIREFKSTITGEGGVAGVDHDHRRACARTAARRADVAGRELAPAQLAVRADRKAG